MARSCEHYIAHKNLYTAVPFSSAFTLTTAMAETAMQQQVKVEIESVDMKAGMEKIKLLHAFPISTWPAINAVRLHV